MVEKAKGDVHLETVEEAEDEVQNLQKLGAPEAQY